ncbi:MAG: murein biosynthesis integral membrane protein MurJ [Deltaproteobacteria bacterium]|nr:murein biosynthesis integral membrane protein MurJ [Deltaproteobacteria bacterium]
MSENANVTKRAGLIGFLTFLSRITGLLRDAVVAFFFGAGWAADAFYMAFTIPNLLRRFVAEGALTISFIPIFTQELKKSKESAKKLSDQAFSYLFVVLLLITLAGIWFAPAILKAMAAGFEDEPQKFALTLYLTRLCFPYILFVSLAALVMGVLNSLKMFGAPAASPICLNLGLVAGAIMSPWFDPPVLGLAVGILLGGFLQLVIQLPWLIRAGFFPRIDFNVHPELKALLLLMLPAAYGAAVYQVNVIIMRLFASYLPTGAISYLWYASRLFEFPMGVFAIALATAIQPTLSEYAAEKNWEKFKHTLNYGLRLNFLITIPAMTGLILLSHPLVRVLLQRGEFDPVAAHDTATAMMAFALGLPFLGLVRIIVPAFYSLKDSKTPVIFATLAVATNLCLAWWWVGPFKHNGLALALSASSFVNAVGLLIWMRHKVGALGIGKMVSIGWKAVTASAIMGLFVWWPQHKGWFFIPGSSLWLQGAELILSVVASIFIFFGVAKILGCEEAHHAFKIFKRKLLPKAAAADAME